MQIEYTNLDLESSYVYLAIYVLQIVVEKLLLSFLCKKPHTLMKFPFCLRPKSQLVEFRWILYVSKKVYIDQTYVVYIDIDAFCANLRKTTSNNVD